MQFLLSARNNLFHSYTIRNITSRTKKQNKYFWMVNSNYFKPDNNDNDIEYDDYEIIQLFGSLILV